MQDRIPDIKKILSDRNKEIVLSLFLTLTEFPSDRQFCCLLKPNVCYNSQRKDQF